MIIVTGYPHRFVPMMYVGADFSFSFKVPLLVLVVQFPIQSQTFTVPARVVTAALLPFVA